MARSGSSSMVSAATVLLSAPTRPLPVSFGMVVSERYMRDSESVESPTVRRFQPRQQRSERAGSSVTVMLRMVMLP